MATSGSFNTNNPGYGYLTFSWSRTSYSVANNYSDISWKVVFTKSGTGWVMVGGTSVTVNGTTKSVERAQIWTGDTVISGTSRIYHNADGTKSFSASLSSAIYAYAQNATGSGSWALNTIPRATTPSVNDSSPNIGETITISMPRASTSFTHTLSYSCGNSTGVIGSKLGTSKSFTIPESLYNEITTSTSKVMNISCKTYNGTALIGTKSIPITVCVPSNVVPTIDSITVSEMNTHIKEKFNAYIQSKSNIKVLTSASGIKGSAITSVVTKVNSKSLSGSSVSFIASESGEIKILTTITDSRGRTASETNTITVLSYNSPKITDFTAFRADDLGNEYDEGLRINSILNFNISSLSNKNDKAYTLEMSRDEIEWIRLKSGSVYTLNSEYLSEELFDTAYAYKVRLTVSDYFTTVSLVRNIPVGYTILNFNASGRGIGVGKVSEKNAFEVNMETYFTKEVHGINLFPVGAIYMSINSTNPASIFGGSWQRWGKGRVPVSIDESQSEFNTSQKMGGHKALQEHSHNGVTNYAGTHSHGLANQNNSNGPAYYWASIHTRGWNGGISTLSAGNHAHSFNTNATGSGNAQNLQPYITCYMWVRIS